MAVLVTYRPTTGVYAAPHGQLEATSEQRLPFLTSVLTTNTYEPCPYRADIHCCFIEGGETIYQVDAPPSPTSSLNACLAVTCNDCKDWQ